MAVFSAAEAILACCSFEMAEPLSFVASVIAISTLAGTVATKGYRYLKAVRDCREDVPKLIVEVNVLCGILERLVVLLGGRKAKSSAIDKAATHEGSGVQHDSRDGEESDASSDSDSEPSPGSEALHTPNFIYECRKTLLEIEGILNKFGHQNIKSSQSSNEGSRYAFSKLRGLTQTDLKWPLSRSKTRQLFEALERHKSTCTIALAKDGLVGIHAVLEQTTLSNKHLAELRAKQEKMLEICITQDQGECSLTSYDFKKTSDSCEGQVRRVPRKNQMYTTGDIIHALPSLSSSRGCPNRQD